MMQQSKSYTYSLAWMVTTSQPITQEIKTNQVGTKFVSAWLQLVKFNDSFRSVNVGHHQHSNLRFQYKAAIQALINITNFFMLYPSTAAFHSTGMKLSR